jgi:hypothetical protein
MLLHPVVFFSSLVHYSRSALAIRGSSTIAFTFTPSQAETMAQRRQEELPQEIRKAAGGKNVATLRQVVTDSGWTSQELDDLAASGSHKGAIHMAAWRGSLENVEYLLDLGCDINLVSQGQYSYGKTPLFFALTQNRDDAVRLLLQRGALVKIVNNKGQSVLSLATPSHVSIETRALIQQAETEQAHVPWVNYRATHSDGFEYGDLDPRFLDRPLKPTDVVQEFVVNPTTRETRKGKFNRLNQYTKNKEEEPRTAKPTALSANKKREKQRRLVPLTLEEIQKREACWTIIQQVLVADGTAVDAAKGMDDVMRQLVVVVQIRDRQGMNWIQEEAERLEQTLQEADSDYFGNESSHIPDEWVLCLKEREDVTRRQVTLVRRLLMIALKTSQRTAMDADDDVDTQETPAAAGIIKRSVPRDLIIRAQIAVSGLPKALLQKDVSAVEQGTTLEHLFTLPRTPRWVDSVQDVRELYNVLVERHKEEQVSIGVDTEWHDDENGSPRVATLQVAIPSGRSSEKSIDAWVLDMMPTREPEYHSEMIKLVQWIFHKSESVVLGFAFGHDLPKLNAYLHHHDQHLYNPISMENIVDLQIVAAYYVAPGTTQTKSTLPSLKTTCARYLASAADSSVTYALEKKEQCSDWSQRPLRLSQLKYAGLDAGVLLVLLKEMTSDLVPL